MADVFINYAREDRDLAATIATSLVSEGLSAWSDLQIPVGVDFVEAIETAMKEAGCILTIWSPRSVDSNWVRAEAEFALKHNKLFPVAVSPDVKIPPGFQAIQTIILDTTDRTRHDLLPRLAQDVRRFVQQTPRHSATPAASRRTGPIGGGASIGATSAGQAARRKAFISYADADETIAIDLVKHLESAGCPCWIAFRDVDPGDDYRASITRAMDEIAFLVLVYSSHVNTSFDVATELLLARRRNRRRFVLRTDNTQPSGPVEYELATVQWIDCQADRQAAFERIAQRAALL